MKRVVLDGRGEAPPTARLFRGSGASNTILATTPLAAPDKLKKITGGGAACLKVPARRGRVSLKVLFRKLAEQGVMRLLVEGGGETAAAVLEEGLVDEVHLFIAPIIIGGRKSPPAVGGLGVKSIKDAYRLTGMTVNRLGDDMHVLGYVKED